MRWQNEKTTPDEFPTRENDSCCQSSAIHTPIKEDKQNTRSNAILWWMKKEKESMYVQFMNKIQIG
jgi:hypothetical protein